MVVLLFWKYLLLPVLYFFLLCLILQGLGRLRATGLLTIFPVLVLAAGGGSLFCSRLLPPWCFFYLLLIGLILSLACYSYFVHEKGDYLLLILPTVLMALGIVFLARIDPLLGIRQSCWVLVAFLAFLLVRYFVKKIEILASYKYSLLVLGVLFLALTFPFGIEAGGARSWVSLGFLSFQPSEFVKFILIIFLAAYLTENREVLSCFPVRKEFFYPLILGCGLPLVLLAFQNDLGMALLFFLVSWLVIYVGTGRFSYFLTGFSLLLTGALGAYFLFPHIRERIAFFLDFWRYQDTGGYQIVQSLLAFGNGGLFGWGLGNGFPEMIPAVHTDFLLALIGEELGLAGSLAVIAIYALIFLQGVKVSLESRNYFNRLLAFGLIASLAIQTLIISGGVTSLLPLTGITFPFLSYGGSSLVASAVFLSLLIRTSEGVDKADAFTYQKN